jgi:hypothetical protein
MSRVVLDLREAANPYRIGLDVPPHLAASARATWRGRMIQEYGSSHVFEAIADQLSEAGFPMDDVETCRGFAAEERHHGVLCGAVVESLGGEAWAEVDDWSSVPRHEDVGRTEAVLRNLLSVSCLSETVAVSLIAAERIEMPRGPLHDVLTGIWSDEIGHARFGWRIVREQVRCLSHAARERLEAYLVVALAHLERHELSHLPLLAPPPDGAKLGLCNGADARTLFYETVEVVIVPRLEALGLRARQAWELARAPSLAA